MSESNHLLRLPGEPRAELWREVEYHIQALVEAGKLKPGERLPPHTELCRQVGVSQMTLQRALRALAQKGVITRRRGRGTFISSVPGSQGASWIAVVTRPIFDAHYSQWDTMVAQALLGVSMQLPHGLHFYHDRPTPGNGADSTEYRVDERLEQDVMQQRVVGVISLGGSLMVPSPFADFLARRHIPFVGMTAANPTDLTVHPDYRAFCRMALERAAAEGRNSAAMIESAVLDRDGRDMLETTLFDAATTAGLKTRKSWCRVAPQPRAVHGHEEMLELWQGRSRPEAVIVSDDVMALGVARALVELGVRVPEDLLVITHANRGSNLEYPLPFLRLAFDPVDVAGECTRLLEARLEGRRISRKSVGIKPRWEDERERTEGWNGGGLRKAG